MQIGDIVSMRCNGRVYFARIELLTERKAHVVFVSKVPVIDGHRRKKRALWLSKMHPHGVAGVDYKVDGVGKREGSR